MRFHLVDKIIEICFGKYIVGVKCISLADDIFNEHFPGYPIFPGSLILEGMAQLGGSFFEIMMNHYHLPLKRSVLTIVNRLKFRKPAFPGDKLIIRADILSFNQNEFGVVKVSVSNENEICAEGELIFNFFDIPNLKLQDSRQELYDFCMRDVKIINQ